MRIDKKYAKDYFNSYNKLCDKAKELIFIDKYTKSDNEVSFFDIFEIDDYIIELSPIEQILFVAMRIYEIDFGKNIKPCFDIQTKINYENKFYIADFLIESIIFDKQEYILKNPVIIECDGYDFHSSKSQLNKDYIRENNLKTAGYDIIRFTGSQIYNNPYECVHTIYEYINKIIKNKEYIEE